jgi:hypothetical protein
VDEANMTPPSLTSAGYLWPKVDAFGNVFSAQCNSLGTSGPPIVLMRPAPNRESRVQFDPGGVL